MTSTRIRTRTATALVAAVLALGACGSDDSGGAMETGDPATQQGSGSDATVQGNAGGAGDSTNNTAAPVTAEGADARQSGGSEVTIKTFAFDPTPIRVKAGTTVTWTNQDQTLHTVTEGKRGDSDHDFDGELSAAGATFEHAFAQAGTFDYHCTRHPGMDAQVIVE